MYHHAVHKADHELPEAEGQADGGHRAPPAECHHGRYAQHGNHQGSRSRTALLPAVGFALHASPECPCDGDAPDDTDGCPAAVGAAADGGPVVVLRFVVYPEGRTDAGNAAGFAGLHVGDAVSHY